MTMFEDEGDDFEGFGSLTEMAHHKDDLINKQLNDPQFIAQIKAQEEAKQKEEERKKKLEQLKKEAIEKAKKAKEQKEMKERLKKNMNKRLLDAKAKVDQAEKEKAKNQTQPAIQQVQNQT